MPRRMSVALTLDSVRARVKTVTRRHADTWPDLRPGDRLTLVEKGMGLRKGERQKVVCDVEIVDVRVEPLHLIDEDEVIAEGCDGMLPGEFATWWAENHGHRWTTQTEFMAITCRRIEWRYLDPATDADVDAELVAHAQGRKGPR